MEGEAGPRPWGHEGREARGRGESMSLSGGVRGRVGGEVSCFWLVVMDVVRGRLRAEGREEGREGPREGGKEAGREGVKEGRWDGLTEGDRSASGYEGS